MNGNKDKEEKKVVLAYLAVCIFWGSTYLAIRIGVSELPATIFAGVRFLVAGSIMLAFAKLKGLEFPKKTVDIKRIAIVGMFLLLGGNGLVVWGEKWVSSGMTSLIVATGPLYTAIIETFFTRSKSMNIKGWCGILMGFVGVGLLVLPNLSTGATSAKGVIFVMLSAILWSSGSIYSKSFKASGSVVTHIGIQMLSGGIGLSIIGTFLGELPKIQLTGRGVGALLYLVLFGSIVGYSCYIYILQKWPASKASTYAYVNPVVAVLLGAVILKEAVSITILVSTVVILVGVFLVQTSGAAEVSQQEKVNGESIAE
ncbi:EamA family transporter [Clostridium sp. CX1]|uniref:EamA family transporter n=1 Tax=Clostridium sp. CX1 TaxID=2978346 RepID=UPI0021C00F07|nr:EamA family transporter [Clostridium sp. CX1]MCT8978383.1 EamA family transporter [Clostridium sp. CX1]